MYKLHHFYTPCIEKVGLSVDCRVRWCAERRLCWMTHQSRAPNLHSLPLWVIKVQSIGKQWRRSLPGSSGTGTRGVSRSSGRTALIQTWLITTEGRLRRVFPIWTRRHATHDARSALNLPFPQLTNDANRHSRRSCTVRAVDWCGCGFIHHRTRSDAIWPCSSNRTTTEILPHCSRQSSASHPRAILSNGKAHHHYYTTTTTTGWALDRVHNSRRTLDRLFALFDSPSNLDLWHFNRIYSTVQFYCG